MRWQRLYGVGGKGGSVLLWTVRCCAKDRVGLDIKGLANVFGDDGCRRRREAEHTLGPDFFGEAGDWTELAVFLSRGGHQSLDLLPFRYSGRNEWPHCLMVSLCCIRTSNHSPTPLTLLSFLERKKNSPLIYNAPRQQPATPHHPGSPS